MTPDRMVPIPYWLPTGSPGNKPSDVCYACLDHEDPPFNVRPPHPEWDEWWENFDMGADVYVGRLTADEIHQVQDQVNKIIYYENKLDPPPQGIPPWYDRMLFVADEDNACGGDYFYKTFDDYVLDAEYDIPLPYVELLHGKDPGTTNDTVMDEIEIYGCNIVNYHGHGAHSCWLNWTINDDDYHEEFYSFFNDPHVKDLRNEHLVVAFDIGCNMAWVDTPWGDTIGDWWLRWEEQEPNLPYHGAVASMGATRLGLYGGDRAIVIALYQTMYGIPGDPIQLEEPLNILGMVHYGTLTRANDILEDPEPPSLSHLAILGYVYNHILQGDPSMEIRNKYTEEVTTASGKQNLPLQKHPLQVTVYPNPSSGIFTLNIKGDTSGVDYVKVYDLAGRLIRKIAIPEQETPMTTSVTTPPEMEMMIDLSTLSGGLYILGVGDEVIKRAVICK